MSVIDAGGWGSLSDNTGGGWETLVVVVVVVIIDSGGCGSHIVDADSWLSLSLLSRCWWWSSGSSRHCHCPSGGGGGRGGGTMLVVVVEDRVRMHQQITKNLPECHSSP